MNHVCYVLMFTFLLISVPSQAQDESVEDTLDWRGYYPMQVGHIWEYSYWSSGGWDETHYLRREIVGDTTIEGRGYYVQAQRHFSDLSPESAYGQIRTYLRYDETRRTVVEWNDEADEEQLYIEYLCDFGAPFNASVCEAYVFSGLEVTGGRDTTGDGTVHKRFYYVCCGGHYRFEHGTGPTDWLPLGYGYPRKVYYTRIDSVETGRSRFPEKSPSSVEPPAPEPPSTHRPTIHAIFPQPSTGPITVTLHARSPGTIHIDIFDISGRRISRRVVEMGDLAGQSRVHIDGSAWSPGIYFIRVTDGSGRQAAGTAVLSQ